MISHGPDFRDIDTLYVNRVYEHLDRLGRLYVLRAFRETGVLEGAGEQYKPPELMAKMGVSPEYGRLFDVLLIILKNAGFISFEGGTVTSLGPAADRDVREITLAAGDLLQDILRDYPEMTTTVVSLAKCMDNYSAVLTGRMSSAEALFPNGSMEVVENMYTNNRIQAFFNSLTGQKVREFITSASANAPLAELRILEVGAGTGSAAGPVLSEISGLGNISYCYTDIASVFTRLGEVKFGAAYPFMTFKTLNIEEDLEAQGFQPASWDVVVASNVLHATGRIDNSLRQVRKLLKPGGALIMNEVTRFRETVNVIFGLTSGWWLFEDEACRIPHCPSLSLAGWKAGLEGSGFINVRHSGLPDDSGDDPVQCVVVAENGSACGIMNGSPAASGQSGRSLQAGCSVPALPQRGRRSRIESEVRGLMHQASEIEVSGADADTNLFELGFASLMIARLKDLIKRSYSLDMQMSWFYSRVDTFSKIVDFIDREAASDAGQASGEPAYAESEGHGPRTPQGDAGDIISRQIELMDRQLAVMSDQLNALTGGGNVNRKTLPIEDMPQDSGITGARPEAREPEVQAKARNRGEEFVAYRGLTGREKLELNIRQKAHLKKLLERYTGLTAGSKERTQKYRPVFANTRNIAGFRPEWKEMIYQIIVDRAEGSHFTDIDGRDYLDISMGFGVYLLGHNPSFVRAALQREVAQGTPIGPMSDRAGKVATLIHELTGVERVAFFNTGTEAVMAALRIARTVTGRRKIALFSSSYHGHFDGVLAVKDFEGPLGSSVPMSPGSPRDMVSDVYVLDYGAEESLQFIEAHGRELAAVLVEPVQSRRPDLQPAAFLRRLREITSASGSALIFDEVILGFRIHPGGGQAWFGIQADIVTYGKVVGGGLPIGVVAGRAQYLDAVDGGMWKYGDKSFPERENTFIAGTFNHHPLAMAGAYAVLEHLKDSGPSLQENLNQRTAMLAERLNGFFEAEGVPIRMLNFGSLFRIPLKGDQELLYYHLLTRGIYIWEGRNCFLSTAHTDEDIDYLVKAVQESIMEMLAGGLFPGTVPASPPEESPVTAFPLSSSQNRLYILSRLEGGERSHHVPMAFFVEGRLDRAAVEENFRQLILRHPALRTSIVLRDGQPVQQIAGTAEFSLDYRELTEGSIGRLVDDFMAPFDLSKAPLIRVCMAKTGEDRHFFIIDTHHIVFDGASGDILMGEFFQLCNHEVLQPLRASYKDYARREKLYLGSDRFKTDEAFWLAHFSPAIEVLNLPVDRQRPAIRTFRGSRLFYSIDRTKTGALKQLSARTGSSLFMTLFAAHYILLYRLTGQQDIAAATTFDARKDEEFQNVIGMFVNTVAIRNRPEGDKTFASFVGEVKKNVLEAFDCQDYPFDLLPGKLNLKRDMSRNPLFDTMFVYEDIRTSGIAADGLKLAKYDVNNKTAMFDLTLEILEIEGGLNMSMEFSSDIFEQATIERFLRYYERILEQITAAPDIRLSEIELLPEDERQKLLSQFAGFAAAFPEDKTMADIFEYRVGKTPDNIALIFEDIALTYRELNERADRLAGFLMTDCGLGREDLVGMMFDRSELPIIAMLAILKAGAAFMPVDAAYPVERIRYMFEDSRCRVLLTEKKFADNPVFRSLVPGLKILDASVAMESGRSVTERTSLAGDLAYVIYTSGTTGRPKGVMLKHSGFVNMALAHIRDYGIRESDRMLQFSSFSSDSSLFEIFLALYAGAGLVMLRKETIFDTSLFLACLEQKGVTAVFLPPVYLNSLGKRDLKTVRMIITGGAQAVTDDVVHYCRTKTYFNSYGPTEATVAMTWHKAGPDMKYVGHVTIGRPIANTYVYILDDRMRLAPIGVPGEIFIGGECLARGYLNKPELTSDRFVANPFEAGKLLYRSGDAGRWQADGLIQCLGRKDDQVKVRGFRIELREVEYSLLQHPSVERALVLARQKAGETDELTAYIVCRGHADIGELRRHMARFLPDYMIPAYFVTVDEFPVTPNGKIDKDALPVPAGAESNGVDLGSCYALPRSSFEKRLVRIWEAVLGRENIGIHDDFFALGGDSIKAIQILSRLGQEGLKLEARHIFETPTIFEAAKQVSVKERSAQQGPVTGAVPLTPIQSWLFKEHTSPVDHYTQAVMLYSGETVDEEALRSCLLKLQEHHDALRMTFRYENGLVVQENSGPERLPVFDTVNLKGRADAGEELARLSAEVPEGFDIGKGPLIKTLLFRMDDGDRLLIVVHHLAIDGVSWRILLEDLALGYGQAVSGKEVVLPLKTDSFRLWADKLLDYSKDERLLNEKDYWRKIEQADTLFVPSDFPAESNCYGDIEKVSFELDEALTDALLSRSARSYNTEVSDILLTSLARTLKSLYGGRRVVIELEGHGREPISGDIDLSRTVGWFTSVYPVVLELPDTDEPGRQIKEIKESLRQVPGRGIGYGILKYLLPAESRRDIPFELRPQILFNYLGAFDGGAEGVFRIDPKGAENTVSGHMQRSHDFEVEAYVLRGRFSLVISYNRKAFRKESAEGLLAAFRYNLTELVGHCTAKTTSELTPHDLSYKKLSLKGLDEILADSGVGCGNLKDVYPLSPLQEGMLFHAMYDEAGSAAYFEQISFEVIGKLDILLFQEGWDVLCRRYDALRTVFVQKGLERPLQVVCREGRMDYRFRDMSSLSQSEKKDYLEEFRRQDIDEGFDFFRRPPMRVTVIQFGERSFEVVWSMHHILTDGWCSGILMTDLFGTYSALKDNREPELRRPAPYSRYINWIEGLDMKASLSFWRAYLQDYERPSGLPRQEGAGNGNGVRQELMALELDEQVVRRIKKIASENHVTVSTFIQSAWGVLLGRYNGVDDVVFAATVSGRPADLPGIEEMVGLFINAIPVRVRMREGQTFRELMKQLQRDAIQGEAHHYCSLADIQSSSALKRRLLDHVLVFENYPLAEELTALDRKYRLGFSIGKVEVFELSTYDLTVVVTPGERLQVLFRYNTRAYSTAQIGNAKEVFSRIIGLAAANPDMVLEEIKTGLMNEQERKEQEAFLKSAMEIDEEF